MNILSLNHVNHAFGGPKLLDQTSLHIEAGDRICLLNKTGTLPRLILANTIPAT